MTPLRIAGRYRRQPPCASLTTVPRRAVSTSARVLAAAAAAAAAPPPAQSAPSPPTPGSLLHVGITAPPKATAGSGMYMRLKDGRAILDGVSGGAAVACLGSSNPDLVEVMAAQAAHMPYAYHQSYGNLPGEELAQFLVERSDGAFSAAAFMSSGSEAIEAIIKIARQYYLEKENPEPKRRYIIARFPAYHGNTLGALGAGNQPFRRDLYLPMISDAFQHVTSPQYKRFAKEGESEEAYSERCAAELEAKIQELGPENVAAFIAEPVNGSSIGCVTPPKGYFPAIKRVLDKHGILLAMDEVMCGTGRSGTLYAWQAVGEGVQPDIVSIAKNLGAGYAAISGVVIAPRIVDPLRASGRWKNSHTYQNHPINCAVALAVLNKVEKNNLLANVNARGAQIQDELRAALKDDKYVFDIRGKGLFIGVEFDAPDGLNPRLANRVKDRCFENGLLVLPITGGIDGDKGDTIMLAPAYIVSPQEASEMVRIFVQSVKEVEAEIEGN